MDIEQLKLVIEAVQQLGAQGKEAFIWWVVLDKALPGVVWLITLPCLMAVIYWLIRGIQSANADELRLRQLRDVLLDAVYRGGHVGESDFQMMMAKAEGLKK